MLAACILSYDMYTFLIVFQLSYQIQMRQFDNWPSKSKLREQVSTLGFDLRELIFGLRRLPNQYIMREINVGRGLATSHHVWHVGLWHQTSSSTSTKKAAIILWILKRKSQTHFFVWKSSFGSNVVSKHQRLSKKNRNARQES